MEIIKYQVVVAYDGPYGTKGSVISCHSTYDHAARALARKEGGDTGWLKIVAK